MQLMATIRTVRDRISFGRALAALKTLKSYYRSGREATIRLTPPGNRSAWHRAIGFVPCLLTCDPFCSAR